MRVRRKGRTTGLLVALGLLTMVAGCDLMTSPGDQEIPAQVRQAGDDDATGSDAEDVGADQATRPRKRRDVAAE